jgi:hypothetical protein
LCFFTKSSLTSTCGGGAVGRGAALELRERPVHLRRGENLLERVFVPELRVRVVDRVLVVLLPDLRELLGGRAVALHVLDAGVAEELRRRRRGREAAHVDHRLELLVERVRAVGELRAERALLHLLEAEGEDAVGDAALDELLGHEQRRRARRAVVVDVVHGDAGHAERVDGALAARRVAVAVADRRLLDRVVWDARVGERLLAGLLRHVRVVPALGAGLLELGHADSDDEYLASHVLSSWLPESGRRTLARPATRFNPGATRRYIALPAGLSALPRQTASRLHREVKELPGHLRGRCWRLGRAPTTE